MLAVRWYLRFGLSYRDLEELLAERGIEVDHVTLYRWVRRFTPELVDAARPCRHAVGGLAQRYREVVGDGSGELLAGVARRMVVDHATLEVVGALRGAAIEPVLLKGPAVARWLYDRPDERSYDDADLLLAPADFAPGEDVLRRLGYERFEPPERAVPLPAGQRPHADTWTREDSTVAIDLHRCLHHTEHVPAQLVWDEVWRDRTTLDVHDTSLTVPSVRVRLLHIVVHLQPKDVPGTRAWIDLERAIHRVDREDWVAAVELADRFGVRAEVGALLALVDGGAELAEQLSLDTTPTDVLLQEHRRHVPAIPHLARRVKGRPAGETVRVVLAKVSLARVRAVTPLGEHGRVSLGRAYAHQLARISGAIRDWVRYRRRGGGRALR